MLDVKESTCRFLPSSARAKNPRSGIQKSSLKRRLSSAACFSSSAAHSGSFQTSRASRAVLDLGVVSVPLQLARRARQRGRESRSANAMESHESFQHWFSSPVSRLRRSYSMYPSPSRSPYRSIHAMAARACARARAPGRCHPSSARTPPAGPGTAGSSPRSRNRASAGAPRKRSSRRGAARAGSCQAPRPGRSSRTRLARGPAPQRRRRQLGQRTAEPGSW